MGRFTFFTLLIVCCATIGIRAQPCVPEPVETVDLVNGTLSWLASENCGKAQYQVLIKGGGLVEYEYTVETLTIDVSFLKMCRQYEYSVSPVVDHLVGPETTLRATIPLAEGVEVNPENITFSQIVDDVLVQWKVHEDLTYCVRYHYLRTWDEESTDPQVSYVGLSGHLIENAPSCMNYHFELTIFYDIDIKSTVQTFNYTVPDKTNTPTLVEVKQDYTVINSTWKLEPFSSNRCEVTTLYVNGTHFNEAYPIEDTRERPDVHVSITGLKTNSMYYFNVATKNSAGISPPFQMAVQTLPLA